MHKMKFHMHKTKIVSLKNNGLFQENLKKTFKIFHPKNVFYHYKATFSKKKKKINILNIDH